ncbi:glycosyltransferase [Mucilaginibacter conchicola]|uniref:Glycosyltransferase n=1 Tax=Mucilaginibacter conchicola TaxID=2303333 RepID=A0A372NYV7_9SPHI|nr:glycosyltransferase family 4 protein [Mucilaginibacter conchicola]RFZ94849.1 glycosyltransferase [Mucilaginibacter conchicola]
MKVVILGNDLKAYWKGRIGYLYAFFAANNIELFAIEIFGQGSPYAFDKANEKDNYWKLIFPDRRSDQLTKKQITKGVFHHLDKLKPDVIISSSIVFYAGALGLRWAKKNNKKFIMFDDMKVVQVKRNFLVQSVKNLITSQVDGFWFPTEKYYADYCYYHNKDIEFIYGLNCVDNQKFKTKGQKKLNHNTLICVARLVPVKNLERLLMAWQLVEEKHPHYLLKIIGDGPLLDNLTTLKQSLQLKNVEFLGAVDNSAVIEHYFNADALVLPSLTESWGLVVNEAMSASLPVILSDTVNAAESLLEEGGNGFSFDPLDVSKIAGSIQRFVHLDEDEKARMSDRSLQIIEEMSYKQMGDQLLDGIIKVKSKPGKSSLLSSMVINYWAGGNNIAGWDTLKT